MRSANRQVRMNIDEISLVVLCAILIGTTALRRWLRTDTFKPALVGIVAALLATAIATICFVAVEFDELAVSAILFGPLFEGAVVAALAAAVLGFFRHRVKRAAFAAAVTLTGMVLAWIVGPLFVGHLPHFSHDKAVAFLVVSWAVVALATEAVLHFVSDKSLERRRGTQVEF